MKSDNEFLRKLANFENIGAQNAENLHKRIEF
jgi:hypothetical protein